MLNCEICYLLAFEYFSRDVRAVVEGWAHHSVCAYEIEFMNKSESAQLEAPQVQECRLRWSFYSLLGKARERVIK